MAADGRLCLKEWKGWGMKSIFHLPISDVIRFIPNGAAVGNAAEMFATPLYREKAVRLCESLKPLLCKAGFQFCEIIAAFVHT